jgi:transcriptional regulator with XRE-family HTH domain
MEGMDSVRLGLAIRALRRRTRWTQQRLADRAGVSQSTVSRVERGELRHQTLHTLATIAEALGARASVKLYWHGEDLDRLLDAAHAGLVEQVVALLVAHGWEVLPEATFNDFGERGSIDVLAFHPGEGALLVIEVKSVVPDMQALLAGINRKVRIAPKLARAQGWRVRSVSRLLVLGEDRTSRRRLERHAATVRAVLPLGSVSVRRWIAGPRGPIGGVLFLPPAQGTGGRHRIRPGSAASVATQSPGGQVTRIE